jgi:hypothetical protein
MLLRVIFDTVAVQSRAHSGRDAYVAADVRAQPLDFP